MTPEEIQRLDRVAAARKRGRGETVRVVIGA
jgi:hypothetical protein